MDRKTFDTWNKVANVYADTFMELQLYNQSYIKFYTALPSSRSRVLEVGCGPGNVAKYILNERPVLEWLGIDYAPNMIQLARKFNPTAHFKTMDGRCISDLKKTFDGIICGFFIPYVSTSEAKKFISDCHKLLNTSGILYLSFIDGDPASSKYLTSSQGDQVYFYYHRKSQLIQELQDIGFALLHTTPVTYTKNDSSPEIHTILIAQKTSLPL